MYLFVHFLSIYLFIYQSTNLSIYPSTHLLSIHISISLSIFQSIYLSICLSILSFLGFFLARSFLVFLAHHHGHLLTHTVIIFLPIFIFSFHPIPVFSTFLYFIIARRGGEGREGHNNREGKGSRRGGGAGGRLVGCDCAFEDIFSNKGKLLPELFYPNFAISTEVVALCVDT